MKRFIQSGLLLTLALAQAATWAADAGCSGVDPVAVSIDPNQVLRNNVPRGLFGFNLPWADFQQGFTEDGKVRADVLAWLKPFGGALYRYPGGTPSNWFEWQKAVGEQRTKQVFDYDRPVLATFGIDEMLQFMNQVDGRAIFTLNLQGPYKQTLDADWAVQNSMGWMQHIKDSKLAHCQNMASAECRVAYWEMGNELDMSKRWQSQPYGARVQAVLNAAQDKFPEARMLVGSQTSPWGRNPNQEADFDQQVVRQMVGTDAKQKLKARSLAGANKPAEINPNIYGVAFHIYYDGQDVPTSMGWANRLHNQWLQQGKDAGTRGSDADNPGNHIVVTEHALWPGFPADNKWDGKLALASGGQGALSTADWILTAAQTPYIEGMNWHAIETGAAWRLFQYVPAANGKPAQVFPLPVYWGQRTLRDAWLDDLIKVTPAVTGRVANYSYGLRMAAMRSNDHSQTSLLGVNRSTQPVLLQLKWPVAASKLNMLSTAVGERTAMNTPDAPNAITQKQSQISVAANQPTMVCVPAMSVFSLASKSGQ
ncbi:hypothetical protein [Amantichitinum ursilacus]|uniref:Alpha-L-arabinofuranosidase 1 catalytic domain-containing protein n=1 Tax=Amantichitinum ursilacus TaxID=857265 RepID=A0A0N0XJL1_9NEIS|nr:hypothetical protein [Amantichitinum ursilacus]KPC51823.1 hypothetical protein WG78_15170 [Amantichitinum ursilacus]